MEYSVYQLKAADMRPEILEQMAELVNTTWPSNPPKSDEDVLAFWKQQEVIDTKTEYSYALCKGGKLLGMARTFDRGLLIGEDRYDCMALSSVVVRPDTRGCGVGKEIVLNAFGRVDRGDFHLSIFQTGVPEFYEKLGCEKISNSIINSLSENPQNNPFWDTYVMCYPKIEFDPQVVIDLRGAGY